MAPSTTIWATCMFFGPSSRAIDWESARNPCLAPAKAANPDRPRVDDVAPVNKIVPRSRLSMRLATSRPMTKAGFDGADLLEKTKDEAVKATLMENTTKAVERGAFGIPTFYVGDEMFFGKERLGQIEEEILKQS